uniref:WASH complex subunit strumpellin n=1 Tax=Heterorhabditis bacteriophora TaxID=37862 RepID=A0A1I7WB40_HETBA
MILREWPLLNQGQVEGTYKMLLEYVASREKQVLNLVHHALANYVISEFLRAVAMILKRGVLDKKTGEQEQVFDLIHNLLTSPTTRLFSSSWRNSTFSITWDFHLKAKAEFEMSLKTLHGLCLQSDILNIEFEKRLCEKFLEARILLYSEVLFLIDFAINNLIFLNNRLRKIFFHGIFHPRFSENGFQLTRLVRNETYFSRRRIVFVHQYLGKIFWRTMSSSFFFSILVGEVLAWSSVEHQFVTNAAADMISPELTRSTLLCLKRIINAASNSTEFGFSLLFTRCSLFCLSLVERRSYILLLELSVKYKIK